MGSPEEKSLPYTLVDMKERDAPSDNTQNGDSSLKLMRGDKGQLLQQMTNEMEVTVEKNRFFSWLEHKRILEKGIFVISIATIAALTHGLLSGHWLIPYYFTIAAPVLIGVRYVTYWRLKYQYFLIDFCYFGNLTLYIYLWAVPHNEKLFIILFGLTNGPLAWAIFFFRNSLVFHSTDKMTSLFIHVIPAFLTYCIRWYPENTATYWYTNFADGFEMELPTLAIWLYGVPFACYVSHGILYMLVVYGILKPSEEYTNSFRYLRDQQNIFGRLINMCGPRFTWLCYYMFYWTYCGLSLSFTFLWFKYHLAHSVFILIICILATWNGASYYIDVFAVRGFKDDC